MLSSIHSRSLVYFGPNIQHNSVKHLKVLMVVKLTRILTNIVCVICRGVSEVFHSFGIGREPLRNKPMVRSCYDP